MSRKKSRKGQYKVVPKEHAELAGEILALGPQYQSQALAQIKKLRDAEKANIAQVEKNRIQGIVKAELQKIDTAAKAARAKRAALGIINPGTMFKFRYKGTDYLGITLRIPPREFNSADDVLLCKYVFSEGDLKKGVHRANKVLKRKHINEGKIVGGWRHSQVAEAVQQVLAEKK
jgi:hypothetical protein